MKLLVVEDEVLLCYYFYICLGEQGYVVDVVLDVEEVFYWVSEYYYDLVVIDFGLLGMSGLDLICELCLQGKFFLILIFIVCGNWQDKVEGLVVGVDDYVVKLFQFEELEVCLNVLL